MLVTFFLQTTSLIRTMKPSFNHQRDLLMWPQVNLLSRKMLKAKIKLVLYFITVHSLYNMSDFHQNTACYFLYSSRLPHRFGLWSLLFIVNTICGCCHRSNFRAGQCFHLQSGRVHRLFRVFGWRKSRLVGGQDPGETFCQGNSHLLQGGGSLHHTGKQG